MEPGTLTHLDRILIVVAIVGGLLLVLLPAVVVWVLPDKPRGK